MSGLRVVDVREQEDGGAVLALEIDADTMRLLIEWALLDLVDPVLDRKADQAWSDDDLQWPVSPAGCARCEDRRWVWDDESRNVTMSCPECATEEKTDVL